VHRYAAYLARFTEKPAHNRSHSFFNKSGRLQRGKQRVAATFQGEKGTYIEFPPPLPILWHVLVLLPSQQSRKLPVSQSVKRNGSVCSETRRAHVIATVQTTSLEGPTKRYEEQVRSTAQHL
jgi:hypothetical protein